MDSKGLKENVSMAQGQFVKGLSLSPGNWAFSSLSLIFYPAPPITQALLSPYRNDFFR